MFSSVLLFLNIGGGEMVVIVFVALLLFGGEKLPELARGLGKGIRDFKDASDGVKREIANQINNFEDKKTDEPVDHYLPVSEAPLELPAAQEHSETEPSVTGSTEHTEIGNGVANTVPFMEDHAVASDAHVITDHAETFEPHNGTKSEPVKTTHE